MPPIVGKIGFYSGKKSGIEIIQAKTKASRHVGRLFNKFDFTQKSSDRNTSRNTMTIFMNLHRHIIFLHQFSH